MAMIRSIEEGIIARQCGGMTVLAPTHIQPRRRVFYLNSYGMAPAWRLIRQGLYPGHHLWGCLELVRLGYEVAMPEESRQDTRFFNYRRQDLKFLRFVKTWLGRDGIVYSGHTVLFWTPLLRCLRLLRCPVVSMLYARGENLRFADGYRGLIALTPAAKARAETLSSRARIAHLSWGVDLSFYPRLATDPKWFLACGKARRDFATLAAAATGHSAVVRVINTELPPGIHWPANVELITDRTGDWQAVSYQNLVHEQYAGCVAGLIVLQADPGERFAAGLTQLLEAMALGRPVIVTRTGAVPGEIDVEKEGCGLLVPPNDPAALARAMSAILENPARAEAMGQAGRRLCETRYNIVRFGDDLHRFFETL